MTCKSQGSTPIGEVSSDLNDIQEENDIQFIIIWPELNSILYNNMFGSMFPIFIMIWSHETPRPAGRAPCAFVPAHDHKYWWTSSENKDL